MTLTHDLPDAQYHAMTHALSSTGARKLLPPSTPAHFDDWRKKPSRTSDAFDLGHVVHRLILGKGADYDVLDPTVDGLKKDGSPAENPTATATWKARVAEIREAGRTPIHVNDLTAAREMADAVHNDPEAGPLFKTGEAEVSVFAEDPITGVPLRARFDWLDGPTAIDVKSCLIGAPGEFDRAASKFMYHVQEAFYRHVAEAAGHPIERFIFVAVEKGTPHVVKLHEWDSVAQVEGKRLVRRAIDTFARCTELGAWPAYEPGVNYMSLPEWMLDDDMVIA